MAAERPIHPREHPVDSRAAPLATSEPDARAWLTVEGLLWLVLLVGAGLTRVANLGRWPLSESEAAAAVELFRFVSGEPFAITGPTIPQGTLAPLGFNINALAMLLFGAGDATARIGSAIAGIGIVLAPWLLRATLGRGYALALSALLLLSPAITFVSRQASGEVWGLLAALLLAIGLTRYRASAERRDAVLVASALGLGLASAATFWTLPPAIGLWALLERRAGRPLPPAPSRRELTGYGALTLLLYGMGSTALLTNPAGLGAALQLPLVWLGALLASPSMAIPFLFVVLVYELLALTTALVGYPLLAERSDGWARLALVWAALTLLPATLLDSGWVAGVAAISLPLTLLGAEAVRSLAAALEREGSRAHEGAALVASGILALFAWINLFRYLARPDTVTLLLILIALAGIPAAALLAAQGRDRGTALRAGGLTALLLLTMFSASTLWQLSMGRASDPREPLVVAPADPDLRRGAERLTTLSIERYRDAGQLELGIQRGLGRRVEWYFRGRDSVRTIEGSNAALPEAVLLRPDAPAPPGYVGQRLWRATRWERPPLSGVELLRWLVARGESPGLAHDEAILYVRLPE